VLLQLALPFFWNSFFEEVLHKPEKSAPLLSVIFLFFPPLPFSVEACRRTAFRIINTPFFLKHPLAVHSEVENTKKRLTTRERLEDKRNVTGLRYHKERRTKRQPKTPPTRRRSSIASHKEVVALFALLDPMLDV
jgi:hypothetical protein